MALHCSRTAALVLASLLLSLGAAQPARAMSVDLLFVELKGAAIGDTNQLFVSPGDQFKVELRLTTDEQGVSAYSVSLDFDSALEDPLLLDAYANILPAGLDFALIDPRGPGDALGEPGFVKHFTGATFTPSPLTESTTMTIGSISFTVASHFTGGSTQLSPVFFAGIDEILSNDLVLIGEQFEFKDITAGFALGGATVTILPEPSTARLIAIAIAIGIAIGIGVPARARHSSRSLRRSTSTDPA